MSEPVGVDCKIAQDGHVRVRRIKQGDHHWQHVEQGRQWQDDDGRHVLIMISGQPVQELLLSAATLSWKLVARHGPPSNII